MLRRVVVSAGITRPAAFHTTSTAAVATVSQISSVSSSSSSSSFTCMSRLTRSQTVSTPVLLANTSLRESRLYLSEEATATSTSTSTNTPKQHANHNSAASTDVSVVTKMNFTPEVLDNRITAMHAAGKHVKVYVDAHLIAWIAMDRASSSANALGQEFVQDLNTALDYVEQMANSGTVKVAVLTSSKATFCVGADIDQMYHVTDINVARAIPAEGHKLFNRIAAEPFPVVAAINGLALGGGFELALACHARVIAANAKVGFPECLLGLLPGGGGTVRTQRLCGLPTTVKWILSSKQIPAFTAYKCGACDAVMEADDRWHNEHRFFAEVRKWIGQRAADKPSSLLRAQRKSRISYLDIALAKTRWGRKKVADEALKMLNKQTKGKYIGQYKALECIMYAATHSNQEGFVKETNSFAELLCTPEAKNQMSLYFLDEGMKKSETKTGIAKGDVPPVSSVAVIGAGVMGSGIAHHFANKGIATTMQDVKSEMIDKGMAMVRDELSKAVHKHKMTSQEMHKKLHLLSGSTSVEALQGADVVVEAAVEVMDVKKKIIAHLEEANVLTEANLFASNTSSLSVTEMQSSAKYAANVVGMHFFNPVAKMPLVEVIKGKATSELATAIIFNLALRTGKKPIIVNDGPGFIVNRILGVYMAEAGRMVANEKCNPFVIDEAITRFGMPMGPFRLLDEVGIDVACHVAPVLENGLHSNRFKVNDKLLQMMRDGLLGKKTHQGFYLYDKKKDASHNTSVVDKYYGSDLRATVPEQEIIDRCVLLMVNEASLILSEKIAQSAEDVDIGMVWGTGFPAYRGGLLQYADHRGLDNIVKRLNELHSKTSHDYFQPTQMLKEMAAHQQRFFPNRPYIPYQERNGYPAISFE